jgi:hypothetical protein
MVRSIIIGSASLLITFGATVSHTATVVRNHDGASGYTQQSFEGAFVSVTGID